MVEIVDGPRKGVGAGWAACFQKCREDSKLSRLHGRPVQVSAFTGPFHQAIASASAPASVSVSFTEKDLRLRAAACPEDDKGTPDEAHVPKHPAAGAPPDEQAVGDMAPIVQRRQLTIADALGQVNAAEEPRRCKKQPLNH